MRQKRIKYVTPALLKEKGVVLNVEPLDLPKDRSIYLEIGAGKGQFITALAKAYPDDFFIALEVNPYVLYRIVEKKEAMELDNLLIVLGDAKALDQYITDQKMAGLYLNFSDPWPKSKHHKRRLTYPLFLPLYQKILLSDAFIQLRTDHLNFFLDSLEYLESVCHFEHVTYDLGVSPYMTEYEIKKRALGPIYQMKGRIKTNDSETV